MSLFEQQPYPLHPAALLHQAAYRRSLDSSAAHQGDAGVQPGRGTQLDGSLHSGLQMLFTLAHIHAGAN